MGHQVSTIGDQGSFVVAFEEAIGALNTNINRDKDSFTASALALEIYDHYRKQKMDLIDALQKEIYPQFG
jgi:phosphomannomutase